MKIAFIGQRGIGLTTQGGGIETHVEKLSIRLARRGHNITVYCRSRYLSGHPTEYQGVKLNYAFTIYRKNLEAIVYTFIATIKALGEDYDVIHYHGVGPATLSWIPRVFKPRVTIIVTFHSQDRFHKKWGLFARLYLRFGEVSSVWFPHACIAVSQVIQVYSRKYYRRHIIYIPNGAEVKYISEDSKIIEFGLKKDGYILNVGRLVRHKGVHYLIDAYRHLQTDKKLVIVGSGSFTDQYVQELRKKASGDPQIIMLGFQSGEVLDQLYANAYLFVQPSEAEGLPIVTLEAMSYGTAVLVSNIPENIEATYNAGHYFINKNSDDLSIKLQYLLEHKDEVEEAKIRERKIIQEYFNWDTITDHVEAVYRSMRH